MITMLRPLCFGALLLIVKCYPINDEDNQNVDKNLPNENETKDNTVEFKMALNDVTYVQNFKHMMADYVKSEYNNLTNGEMDKIRDYLEEFCHNFAVDLKNIIQNGANSSMLGQKVEDGLPDKTFESVKDSIKNELPGMNEDTADHVTYALRRNLFQTRQKIDKVINNSRMAAIENS